MGPSQHRKPNQGGGMTTLRKTTQPPTHPLTSYDRGMSSRDEEMTGTRNPGLPRQHRLALETDRNAS
jgi:hypothetical protein